MRKVLSIFSVLLFSMLVSHCKSTQPQKNVSDTGFALARDSYFALPPERGEVFRIFASSKNYAIKQLSDFDTIKLKQDKIGDSAFSDELKKYNLIDIVTSGYLKVELYPDSGGFYRIRTGRPSKVVEVDKLMSEDVTRFQFQFPKNRVHPKSFNIGYGILLKKEISRAEAEKLLKQKLR